MTIEGVDFSWARPTPQALLDAGKSFVYRYIGIDVGGKSATRAELDEYISAGLAVILGYEEDGEELLGGFDAGVRIGHAVQAALDDLGYPDAVVYANADFDATEAQQEPIDAALDGIASVIGLHRLGLYAGYWVIKRAFDAGKITYGMQTYAWSGGNWDPRAQVQQYSNGEKVDGADVDFDRTTADEFGQIGNPTPAPASVVSATGGVTVDRPVADIQRLVGADPDGIYGPNTTAAVKTWQAAHGLTADGIWGPLSDAAGFPPAATGLVVDGLEGPATISAEQTALGVTVDGIRGPDTISAEQARTGATVDGEDGPDTASHLQAYLNGRIPHITVDGIRGPVTIMGLQTALNAGTF